MVGFSFSPSAKPINEEWQRKRRLAERTTLSLDEWSDIDITKYDLDADDVDLGGRRHPSTYIIGEDRAVEGETDKTYDIRELDTR